jgi:hypothetical protein
MGDDLEQILTEVGPRLRLLRQQRDITLAGLAAATGISGNALTCASAQGLKGPIAG